MSSYNFVLVIGRQHHLTKTCILKHNVLENDFLKVSNKKSAYLQWLRVLKTYLREAEWASEKVVPTLNEFLSNGSIYIALEAVVIIPPYFLGSELTEELIASSEFKSLHNHMGLIGRILNHTSSGEVENFFSGILFLTFIVVLMG